MPSSPTVLELLYFESMDHVKRRFEANHPRKLDPEKAREITSNFRQGRELFATSRDAPPLVKPLLLYYGVLSWTRGLILFQSPILREASLKGQHGLTAHNWRTTLKDRSGDVGELEVRVTGGTFAELTSTTQNVQGFQCGVLASLLERGTRNIPAQTVFKAREVWARMPGLAAVYEETFQEPSYLYTDQGETTVPDGSIVTLRALNPAAVRVEPNQLRERLQLPARLTIEILSWSKGHEYLLRQPRGVDPQWREMLWGHDRLIVAPLAGNLRLSCLSLLFLNAYFLGMLVRYHPTQWADLVHRGTGDLALPLIREATDALESEFPRLLAEALRVPADWLHEENQSEPPQL